MKEFKLALVGATGVVGREARKVLEDPKEFVTYTPEQIKNAKNELAEHPELIKKEKNIIQMKYLIKNN